MITQLQLSLIHSTLIQLYLQFALDFFLVHFLPLSCIETKIQDDQHRKNDVDLHITQRS